MESLDRLEAYPTEGRSKILGIGVVVIDHILSVQRYPQPNSKNEATASRLQVGGPVPTALAWLSHLGHQTHFLGTWGDDAFGDLIEQQLNADGTAYLTACRDQVATPVTQVWLEENTGRRTLVTHRPSFQNTAAQITKEFISQFNVLHLDCWPTEAAIKAATLMKQKDGLVCIDTGSPKEGVAELLKLADIVNCPKRFVTDFCETDSLDEGAKRVAEYGPKIVTVTNGENGAVMFADSQVVAQPAIHVPNVVDTNGAGDVFTAGLIHSVLSIDPHLDVLRFASELAAGKCSQLGNRPTAGL